MHSLYRRYKMAKNGIIIINCGSSSIKFAIYEFGNSLNLLLSGKMVDIGSTSTTVSYTKAKNKQNHHCNLKITDHTKAGQWLVGWLANEMQHIVVKAIGHRIVQGMEHNSPEKITEQLLKELKANSAYDPEHLPAEIKLIEVFKKYYQGIEQVACFDTSFHSNMHEIAKLVPIPLKYRNKGIKRYGYHGLSYTYLMEELERIVGTEKANGKIILAHLGSGASIAAVKNGRSIDTSMGFTPASGLPMSTRSGDIDPGVIWHLLKFEKFTPVQLNHLVNHESGLLGISETTPDMQQLLNIAHEDPRAAMAIDYFCYQCLKWIGAFTAVLGGVDTIIFSGGIGEHAPEIRKQICIGLEFLGIRLSETKNIKSEAIISTKASKVFVRVIKTNEELIIARAVLKILNHNT